MITSGQPALNPRLVKEADALSDAGYVVTVLYAYWNNWGTEADKVLLPQKKWEAIRAGGDPQQKKLVYFLSRIIFRTALLLKQFFKLNLFADWAIARGSFFLMGEAKKNNADLYIGHNLGALPATAKAAKKHGKPYGFDLEDFHRYEVSDNPLDKNVILKTEIEDRYLTGARYITASSNDIGKAYKNLYKNIDPVTILNVFPFKEIPTNSTPNTGLKLFWFSQTISLERGIKDCISVLKLINNKNIELHLLGNASDEVKQTIEAFRQQSVSVYLHSPISPDEIFDFATQFDVGLALEDSIPFNRDICLTNKIFTYMQCGLAIIATDTKAQQALLGEYPEIGKIYKKGNINALAEHIQLFLDPYPLLSAKKASYNLAKQEFNWEEEQIRLLNVVKEVLTD